jgi:hypothetical protein
MKWTLSLPATSISLNCHPGSLPDFQRGISARFSCPILGRLKLFNARIKTGR